MVKNGKVAGDRTREFMRLRREWRFLRPWMPLCASPAVKETHAACCARDGQRRAVRKRFRQAAFFCDTPCFASSARRFLFRAEKAVKTFYNTTGFHYDTHTEMIFSSIMGEQRWVHVP